MDLLHSGVPALPEDERARHADLGTHRHGSDIESIPGPAKDQNEEPPPPDTLESVETDEDGSEEAVDETDVLSMGGPDSIEDIEGGDDVED